MSVVNAIREQKIFFSTGRREAGAATTGIAEAGGLRPALFAGYRDLAQLRHDFPLVLVEGDGGAGKVRSLCEIVNEALLEVAPRGIAGERPRKHALALEREIRARVDAGATGPLSEIWAAAAQCISVPDKEVAQEVLRYTTAALKVDGDVVGCDASMPSRMVMHLFEAAQAAKARAFYRVVDALIVRLSDILRAAFIRSRSGHQPDALRAAIGGAHQGMFDFDAMSRLVGRRAPRDELADARRRRIEGALAALRSQCFFRDPRLASSPVEPTFEFRFDNCEDAAQAFRARLPSLVATLKAIAIAELEADGRYVEADHDAFFESFGDRSLTPDDLFLFPDYLVCIPPHHNADPANANLIEVLSSGLPIRVLVETSDVVEEATVGAGRFAFGVRSARLAMTAMSLGGVFVVQSPASNLLCLRGRIEHGLAHHGPALFSVYSGADAPAAGVSRYLAAASAIESRAFPPFSYDPFAGDNLAARFSLENCPQPEADWPVETFEYADDNWQRVSVPMAFTFADFVLADPRYEAHFAKVPSERWNERMRPLADWLDLRPAQAAECVPYLWAIDRDDVLHRVLVDASLVDATRRCRTLWHRLREQGGVRNSHAERLLARERAAWDAQRQREIDESKAPVPAAAPAAAPQPSPDAASAAAATASELPARSPDEAWIETSRCPSCNECQLINDRMFLYNENKQAYLGDIKAGTYRQLVEAAEACQVSIIHPGKPFNPNEPGLDELIERAMPFQ